MAEVVKLADILRPPRPGRGSVSDQADAWLAYLYSGTASDADREQFSRWLRESPAHAKAYAGAEQLWRDLGGAAAMDRPISAKLDSDGANGATDTAIAPALKAQLPAPNVHRRHRRRVGFSVAASLLVAVVVGGLLLHDPASVRHASGVGEIKTVRLSDGSSVTLSGSTTIVARMKEEGGRHVELLSGRAYFDVMPNRQRPFFVKAAATEIRVVGTAFDVNKRPDGVQVAVTHGLVEVRDMASGVAESVTAMRPPPPVRRVEAGQKLTAQLQDGAVLEEPKSFEPAAELGWKSGHLRYVNTRLDAVVAEVNRFREHKIVLADASLGELRITASFQTNETEQLLSGLAASYPVDVRRDNQRVTVIGR